MGGSQDIEHIRCKLEKMGRLPPLPSDPDAPAEIVVTRRKTLDLNADTIWLRSWVPRAEADDAWLRAVFHLVQSKLGRAVRIAATAGNVLPLDVACESHKAYQLTHTIAALGLTPAEAVTLDGRGMPIPDGGNGKIKRANMIEAKRMKQQRFLLHGARTIPLAALPAQDGTLRRLPPRYDPFDNRRPGRHCFYTGILLRAGGPEDPLAVSREHLVPLRRRWEDPVVRELAAASGGINGAVVATCRLANREMRGAPLPVKLAVRRRLAAIDYPREPATPDEVRAVGLLIGRLIISLRMKDTLPWTLAVGGGWVLGETAERYMAECYDQERAFLALPDDERAAWIESGEWCLPMGQVLAPNEDIFEIVEGA